MTDKQLKKSSPKQTVSFRLSSDELEELKHTAYEHNMTVSEFVRHAVQAATTHKDAGRVGQTIELLRVAEAVRDGLNRVMSATETETKGEEVFQLVRVDKTG
tara:strand:- start:1227 stop:1532 length:306 start_codon:yes stop_codon:yes gene_type:complete